MQPITLLPDCNKPRERLLAAGGEAVSLTELLAVILGTGGSGCGVLETAERVGRSLADGASSAANLQRIPGVGLSKALRVVAALQLPGAIRQLNGSGALRDPEAIYQEMQDMWELPQEHLAAFFLTVRQTKLKREIVSIGTVSASLLHPREVFRPAILANAGHLVLAHNHPSGNPEASPADLQATRSMAEAGHMLGIELLDHVICTRNGFVSLRLRYPELFVGNQMPFC